MKKYHSQQGFTIIELSIATLVFSVLLAICMAAFLNVGRLFVKGVNLSLTQQDARNIMGSISSDIRFSNATPQLHMDETPPNPPYFCIGQHRYKFMLFNHVNLTPPPDGPYSDLNNFGLVRQDVSTGCPAPSPTDDTDPHSGVTHPVEMLSEGMQLNDLHFGDAPLFSCNENLKLCKITINLLFYGAD